MTHRSLWGVGFALVFWQCQNPSAPASAAMPSSVATPAFEELSERYAPFTVCLNGPMDSCVTLQDGSLTIQAGKETDYFVEPGSPPYEKANAPLLFQSLDNTQPFTFTCQLRAQHSVKYDAGMAFVYAHPRHWTKFAYEMDERGLTRLVTVRTQEVSDDNNHDAVRSERIFLKISSDTKVLGYYYSLNGQEWQLVRVCKNDFPTQVYVGIGAQSPMGAGATSVFSEIVFTKTAVKDFRMGL